MFEHLTADKLSELSEEDILAAAAQLKETIQCADSALSVIKAEMTKRVDSFDLSPTLAFNGWAFRLKKGKASWSFSEAVDQLESELKELKEDEKSSGLATKKVGESYWEIASQKSETSAA